jgi:hypothetical protein
MTALSLVPLIQAIPQGAALDLEVHLSGARLFHAGDASEEVWLADLARPPDQPLHRNLFLSMDGRIFRQLAVTVRQEGCTMTDTPGLGWALAVYDERDIHLFVGKPRAPASAVRFSLGRIPVGSVLSQAVFYGLPVGPIRV